MAKKFTASVETLKPDPKYGNILAAKFINCMMWQGKKSVAQRIFYDALDLIAIVEDFETLCGIAADSMGLFLIPSSMVIAACVGGPGVDVSIRVFAPRLGLVEDHVTGSAMCALSPWWVEKAGSPTISVHQASARGGVMFARLFERNVEIAGQARTFFAGDLRV